MKKIIINILAILIFSSCSIFKQSGKIKTSKEVQNDIVTETTKITEETRPGGTLTTTLKPEDDRPKDENGLLKEFIETFKSGPIEKTIYYKPDGSASVKCEVEDVLKRIEERILTTDNTKTEETSKEKQKNKEENFQSEIFLYFFGAGFLLGSVALFFIFKMMNDNKKILSILAEKIT